MKPVRIRMAGVLAFALISAVASAADYPAPKEGDWVARDFRFHTGEVMPELRLHYRTLGNPSAEPVLILHGTGGSGANFLTPGFAGELFGSGQPLDASKYFIILPDAIEPESRRSHRMACEPNFRNTITMTWSRPNTGS